MHDDVHDAGALARLRRYLDRMGTSAEHEGRLRDLLPALEPMVWQSHGQPRGAGWRRLLTAVRAELAASRASSSPPEDGGARPSIAKSRDRFVHLPDEAFDYPVGTRLDVVGAGGSDAVDVELNPFGRYRVVSSERTHVLGRDILTLALQPVR